MAYLDYTNSINVITHNNFINDQGSAAYLVGVFLATSPNVTMNYWSDYNCTDSDGDDIGNTPYIIDENTQDNYPLMNPVDIGMVPEFPS